MRVAVLSVVLAVAVLAATPVAAQTPKNTSPSASAASSTAPPPAAKTKESSAPDSDAAAGKKDGPDWAAALSTLLAAVVGFIAALLVESRSWQRRKAEQVRDAQLKKLLVAARSIQQAGSRVEECKQLFLAAQSNGTAPNAAMVRAKAVAEAAHAASSLEERLAELRLDHLELRVLHVGSDALGEITSLLARLEAAAALLKRAGAGDGAATQELLVFELSMSRLIQLSIDGLRK